MKCVTEYCATQMILPPQTLEGQVVRLSDMVAYINHDADDAIRAGILSETDIPAEITCALGNRHSVRIDTIARDIITESCGKGTLIMSPKIHFVVDSFHSFMYEAVYRNPKAKSEESKVYEILRGLMQHYVDHPDQLPDEYKRIAKEDGLRRAVCDYVSGMTDKYAMYQFSEIFIPAAWQVR